MYMSNINEAKANLSMLIKRALAGDEIIIARANEPLVKLIPVQQDVSPRVGGFWAGKIEIVGDWDEHDNEIESEFAASELNTSESV